MRRKLLIALVTALLGTTVALTGGALIRDNVIDSEKRLVQHPELDSARRAATWQPDTSSPNWKAISDDLGMLLRDDRDLGLRGRLYVRIDGKWRAVAADGLADIGGWFPTK